MIKMLLKSARMAPNHDPIPTAGTQDGWCRRDEFGSVLRKELHRSMRSGLPLSVVMITLQNNEAPHGGARGNPDFLEQLMAQISEHSRDYDVKFLTNPHKIGLLLIDTSLSGARSFVDRIVAQLHLHNETRGDGKCAEFIKSMKICILPFGRNESGKMVSGRPVIEERLKFKVDSRTAGRLRTIKENVNVTLDWETAPSHENPSPLFSPVLLETMNCKGNDLVHRFFKRSIDFAGALVGIIILMPLMLLIALSIKATSRGPVIFTQKRIGHCGESFMFYKFRTMRIDGDDASHRQYVKDLIQGKYETTNRGTKDRPLYKLTDDSRITPLGRILRKTSLDELPQFFNVLVGNMSLVGPRPALTYEAEAYKGWHWQRLLEAKPGITGIWQVSGRSRTTYDEMVRLDLRYIKKRSILLDLKILLKTFKAVVKTDGAL
jgi:lipopolysaccharide/colanic/teichoic acid biosynthesis glycosyltransferase